MARATTPLAVKPGGSASRSVRNGRVGWPARPQCEHPETVTRVTPAASVVSSGAANWQAAVSGRGMAEAALKAGQAASAATMPSAATR